MHLFSSPAIHATAAPARAARILKTAAAAVVCALGVSPAFAQQRPLVTEDPETVGAGQVLVETGFDYARDAVYPVSGLEGHLLRVPLVGVSIGISSIAELQFDGGLYNRLTINRRFSAPLDGQLTVDGDRTSSVEDLVVGTKVRLMSEGGSRPGLAVRFATKLPNASNESGLGLDTTDFFASLLLAKTVESVRIVTNLGIGILGDPTRGDRQNDVLTYGVSFARAISQSAEVVGEVAGHLNTRSGVPPPGTDTRGMLRFGSRYTVGPVRADTALLVGLTTRDPGFGISAGFTYVFNAFQVP
ncbi:MAG: transporter [Acidobacteria bacterium]|nr:transporter [Acidobacteriota bacterium]